ncbi:hypothetical protein J2R96_001500 [Bradyrhizobium elkanii]|nr:hypothetical protein [Bradyrhizobium elkanii]
MLAKLSTAAHSMCIRAARSARAQMTAESLATSPDWMPAIAGRSAARLRYGLASAPNRASAAVDAERTRSWRRVRPRRLAEFAVGIE